MKIEKISMDEMNKSFFLSDLDQLKGLKKGEKVTIEATVKTYTETESTDKDRNGCSVELVIESINGDSVSKEKDKEEKPKKHKRNEDEFDGALDEAIDEEKYKKDDDED